MATPDELDSEEFTDLAEDGDLDTLDDLALDEDTDDEDDLVDLEFEEEDGEDEDEDASDDDDTDSAGEEEPGDDADDDGDDRLDDDEEEDEEESLDVILAREQDLEDEFAPSGKGSRSTQTTTPPGEDEFTCRSCFLVKRRAQLADSDALICLDCA